MEFGGSAIKGEEGGFLRKSRLLNFQFFFFKRNAYLSQTNTRRAIKSGKPEAT